MYNEVKRSMRLVCEVLERDGIEHFISQGQLTVYFPCKADLKYRKLRPSLIRVCVIPQDEGFLLEANLPVALHTPNEKARRQILRLVAKENSNVSCGGLVYRPESQRLVYRAFCFFRRNMRKLDAETVLISIRIAVDVLSDGYQNITNTMDNILNVKCGKEIILPINDETEVDLTCLLELKDEINLLFGLDDNKDDRREDSQN